MNIKNQFPIFEREVNGNALVYLDSAASAQKPQVVLDAMNEALTKHYANVHRGLYSLSEESTEMMETAREKVRGFLNARSSKEIIFTRNATESLNLIAYAWGLEHIEKGDVIVTTELEHHSNLLPWQMVCNAKGAELVYWKVRDWKLEIGSKKIENRRQKRDDNTQNFDSLKEIVETYGNRIKLVAISHVSNVLGTVSPIKEIVRMVRPTGALIAADGCQAVAHMPVDVLDLDVDFYAISGHKLYGPTGIGVLYAKRDLLEYMQPFLRGGEMIAQVQKQSALWKELPWKFEAGTPAIVEAIGLGAAVEFVTDVGWDEIQNHEKKLVKYLFEELSKLDFMKLIGTQNFMDRESLVSFTVNNIHAHDVAQILGEDGICVRAGHHCAQVLHDVLGVNSSVRASIGIYNDKADVDRLVEGLRLVKQKLG